MKYGIERTYSIITAPDFVMTRGARTLADHSEKLEIALEAVREVWAGSEVGLPFTAQEAYAIRLCKQMYEIACEALGTQSPPLGDDQPNW